MLFNNIRWQAKAIYDLNYSSWAYPVGLTELLFYTSIHDGVYAELCILMRTTNSALVDIAPLMHKPVNITWNPSNIFEDLFDFRYILRTYHLVQITAISLLLSARIAGAEPTSTTPVPIPADHDPCITFTDDADYISQSLIMQLEGREVPLRIPKQFFEDLWDRRDGFADTAQMFRVEIGTFLPVSRAQTGRRNEQDIWNWMTFVISDRLPLEELAEFHVEKDVNTLRVPPTFSDMPRSAGPFGLLSLLRGDDQQQRPNEREVFVSLDSVGSLSAVLTCDTPLSANYPICIHWFRAAGIDVELDYMRVELPNWQTLQDDVTAFLTCATSSPL